MGKPYADELASLGLTYSWALGVPIDGLAASMSAHSSFPLLAIGSGGSLSAAHFACSLHQQFTGMVSKPLTPLESVSSRLHLGRLGVMVLSAGGANTDIVSAFQNAALREPRSCMVLCLKEESPLTRLARSYLFVDVHSFIPPFPKDGFLATNSLITFAVLLARAYQEAFASREALPPDLPSLLGVNDPQLLFASETDPTLDALLSRPTLLILYGPTGASAAFDMESKFSEAALGNVQLADFRNFAHGRHHWIAKHPSKTGVVAIFSEDERHLAEKTLQLLPPTIPTARVYLTQTGTAASLGALVAVLHLVGLAGKRHGIDPGRPGVPLYGRRIYRLHSIRPLALKRRSPETVAISRKLACDVQMLSDHDDLAAWRESYSHFIRRIESSRFGAIVFDYDGTLCDRRDRFQGIRPETSSRLTRLLRSGVSVAVATGRGTSARRDLRRAFSASLWPMVYMGYYNGSDLGKLSDDAHPYSSAEPSEVIRDFSEVLSQNQLISSMGILEERHSQISFLPASPGGADWAWVLLQELAESWGLRAVRSSHSIDMVQKGVTKVALFPLVASVIPEGSVLLAIGDKGNWPGNDFELLGTPYSLSVDEVSPDKDTCWNLALPGHKGVQATQTYLDWLRPGNGTCQLSVGGRPGEVA